MAALQGWAAWACARVDTAAWRLSEVGDGHDEDYSQPAGEPALVGPDSVSWQVFRNPLTLLIGGTAAVVLELAEPRVRTGVYDHSAFRSDPLARLRRTGRAAMVTAYGGRSRAEAMIGRIAAMHRRLEGVTPCGQPYRASDPALLGWVHATASYAFLQARHGYVEAIDDPAQDRYYREGRGSARLYGAVDAPSSRAEMARLFERHRPLLEPSPLVPEFLGLMATLPLLPRPLAPLQGLLVRAAVDLLPPWARETLGLGSAWRLHRWQATLLRAAARRIDRWPLVHGAPVQACRRLGLPDDYLYRSGVPHAVTAGSNGVR